MNNTFELNQLLRDIPLEEYDKFEALIKEIRNKKIRTSKSLVDLVFAENIGLIDELKVKKRVSKTIDTARAQVWQYFLDDEAKFNAYIMSVLHKKLDTPKKILDKILNFDLECERDVLKDKIKTACGKYAGLVFPYIYMLSLSNTQSRRSRAGSTFEEIIYKIYEVFNYQYESQQKLGKKIFEDVGLGKKVDSVLPCIECYKQRRNKTIVGTMKTSLRERWQEVAEEIERTNIPEIHLLTVDRDIPLKKAKSIATHNIVIVAPCDIANSRELRAQKNIISFEDYIFEEIPSIFNYWKKRM